jgi:hypothetical protein
MALTDTEIKKAKATEKSYSLNDSGGLYLWITPAGGKLWRWAYLEPRARMMQEWADFLERTQRGSKVLPFRGTAA